MIKTVKSISYTLGIALLTFAGSVLVIAIGAGVVLAALMAIGLVIEVKSVAFFVLYSGFLHSIMLAIVSGGISQIPNYLLYRLSANNNFIDKFVDETGLNKIGIRILLKLGADINGYQRGIWGPGKALTIAIYQKNISMIRFLIEQGADVRHPQILTHAIRLGNLDVVKALIEHYETVHQVFLDISVEDIRQSIYYGSQYPEIQQYLRSKGAHYCLPREAKIKLLEEALKGDRYDVAKSFINEGIVFTSDETDAFFKQPFFKQQKSVFLVRLLCKLDLNSNMESGFLDRDTFTAHLLRRDSTGCNTAVVSGFVYLYQKDNILKYKVKNHFGQIVSGEILYQSDSTTLIDQKSIDNLSEEIRTEIIATILSKVSRDDYDFLVSDLVDKQKQASTLALENNRGAVLPLEEVVNLVDANGTCSRRLT